MYSDSAFTINKNHNIASDNKAYTIIAFAYSDNVECARLATIMSGGHSAK